MQTGTLANLPQEFSMFFALALSMRPQIPGFIRVFGSVTNSIPLMVAQDATACTVINHLADDINHRHLPRPTINKIAQEQGRPAFRVAISAVLSTVPELCQQALQLADLAVDVANNVVTHARHSS